MTPMRRIVLLCAVAVVALGLTGCTSSSSHARTVFTDYNYDQIAGSYLAYFPQTTEVHPGDTVDFRQAWTGEPHTVTLGTAVAPLGAAAAPFVTGKAPVPQDEPTDIINASAALPAIFGNSQSNDTSHVNQAGARPCYLASGAIPNDTACPKVPQPAFNGRQVLFNSGIIPYEGNGGNRFRMKLSTDIAPGSYYYFCLLHGAGMAGFLDVKPLRTAIPSPSAQASRARKEIDAATKRLRQFDEEGRSGKATAPGADIEAGAGGQGAPSFPEVFTDEFYPKTYRAKVGQKVTWHIQGHVVAFDVPRYEPLILIDKSGNVATNPRATKQFGGTTTTRPATDPNGSPTPVVDNPDYDGGHFISSGLPDNDMIYSITFTKPGTYAYACLVHPRMIGTLVVTR